MTKLIKKKSLVMLIFTVALAVFCSLIVFDGAKFGDAGEMAPSYSVSSNLSSVKYGTHSTYQPSKEGLVVKLAKNDRLYFHRAIDLNKKTAVDNIVSLFITPSVVGASDAHYLVMHFTDAYDPMNEIVVVCWDPLEEGWGEEHIYMRTYKKSDVEVAGKSTLTGGINKGKYGTEGLVSFSGQEAGGALIGSREITVSFDYAEKQVFGTKYNTPNPLIADFDDTDFFTQLWDGFTTGEVFLSIEAGNHKSATFDFVITNIAGYDLSEENFTTTRGPEFSVDMSDFGGKDNFTVPVGKKVPLPECRVYSIYDKNLTLNKSVLINGQNVDVVDGFFLPSVEGEYKILYSATDKFGNYAEETITVNAVADFDDINLVLFEETKETVVGKEVKLFSNYEFGGDIVGKPMLRATASLIGNADVSYDIDIESMSFMPQYSGEYVIRYEFNDYMQKGTKIRKLKVLSSDDAYIYELPTLPDYFIKNAKYLLEDAYGYIYLDGTPTKVIADIYAVEDSGSETKIQNLYKVDAEEKVKIIYRVTHGNKTDELSKEIKVVDVNYGRELQITKYFEVLTGTVSSSADANSAQFTFANDGLMQFINSVQGENVAFEFSMLGNGFNSFDIYLVDSVNSDETIKISYALFSEDKTLLSINDGVAKYGLDGSLMTDSTFSFTYSNTTKKLGATSKLNLPINTYLNGKEFKGFSSPFVKMYFGVNGVESDTTLKIKKINNQPICDLSEEGDVMKPEFVISTMRGDRIIGEKITISPITIKDVLDPYVECTISVTAPNGEYVIDSNGAPLQNVSDYSKYYEYTLTEYGSYLTTIIIKDGSLNKTTYGYQNIVVDMVEPTMTIEDDVPTTAKLGEKVTVPSAKVKDDIDEDLEVSIFIQIPNGEMYDITQNKSFKASFKGIYNVYYYVIDSAGNISCSLYKITVE